MIEARNKDKEIAVNILCAAYNDNDTINDTILQDKNRADRLRKLMEYSFDIANTFGKVCLSNDRQAVALILFPDKKKTTLRTFIWDIKFLFSISGVTRALKALGRERVVKRIQGHSHIYHIWYLGTNPDYAGKGIGGALMRDLIQDAAILQRTLYVESRIPKNTEWYKKFGFIVYAELEHAGRTWDCMKKDIT